MIDERALAINPIVPDSVRHNGQVSTIDLIDLIPYHSTATSMLSAITHSVPYNMTENIASLHLCLTSLPLTPLFLFLSSCHSRALH